MRRNLRFGATVMAAAIIGAVGLAGVASAHVTVNPNEATQGGFSRVAFRVPNESATASTTKLEVFLPPEAPVPNVSTMPVPGWTVSVKRTTLPTPIEVHGNPVTEVVSQITWTASPDAVIRAGQFQEFPVSMGPLPKVDAMVFKALQTYSDGNVVRWIDPPPAAGDDEPEHPAPVLRLKPAAAGDDHGVAGSASEEPAQVDLGHADDEGSGSATPLVLSIVGLLAGLGGLVLGGLAYGRTRRSV
jgi:uncharacterized protein YcnI